MLPSAHTHVRHALVAALVGLLVVAGLPALADPEDTAEELEETERELGAARDELDATAQAVTEARAALDAVDEKLAVLTSELRELEDELEAAEASHAAAVQRLQETTARVRAAAAELEALEADEAEHRARLESRVATTYMRGAGASPAGLVTTLLGVSDLHDLSVGLRAVRAVLQDDATLIARTRELRDEAAERRAELAALRATQQDEEAAERAAKQEVAALVARHEELVDEVAGERAERAEIVRRIETDHALLQALVEELEARVSELAVELATQIREVGEVRWDDLDVDGEMPPWAERLPAHGRQWAPPIAQAAELAGVDGRLFAALVWAESNFHPGAVSHAGAVGLAQLMPATAARLGVDPTEPLENLAGGATYLAVQLARFGAVDLALAAYNAGAGAVEAHGGVPPFAETQLYILSVLDRYERLRG